MVLRSPDRDDSHTLLYPLLHPQTLAKWFFPFAFFVCVWVVMASSSKDGVTVKANSDVNGADHARMGQRVAAIIAQYKDTPRNQSHNHSSQS